MTAVLIGDATRKNIDDLTQCPIVIQMFCEVRDGCGDVAKVGMSVCNREYHRRGGKDARTIGAVHEAMMILQERENAARG